jgi:hypothetical protein
VYIYSHTIRLGRGSTVFIKGRCEEGMWPKRGKERGTIWSIVRRSGSR